MTYKIIDEGKEYSFQTLEGMMAFRSILNRLQPETIDWPLISNGTLVKKFSAVGLNQSEWIFELGDFHFSPSKVPNKFQRKMSEILLGVNWRKVNAK